MLLQLEFLTVLADFFTETFFWESSQIAILMCMFRKKVDILVGPNGASSSNGIGFLVGSNPRLKYYDTQLFRRSAIKGTVWEHAGNILRVPLGQTDKFIFILQLQALKKTLKTKKNSRFNVNMQLKLIYLQYEEAVKGREIFESNDYLLFAFMSRMMLTFNSRCSSNKIATSFSMWLIKRKNY